jgi:hypothetical protein
VRRYFEPRRHFAPWGCSDRFNDAADRRHSPMTAYRRKLRLPRNPLRRSLAELLTVALPDYRRRFGHLALAGRFRRIPSGELRD